MTFREYIKLTEKIGLFRTGSCCFYMGHSVCIFWFDNSNDLMPGPDLLNHTGIVKMIKNQEVINESTEKEVIRDYIIKRIEDIKSIKVDDKLKTMEQDFE